MGPPGCSVLGLRHIDLEIGGTNELIKSGRDRNFADGLWLLNLIWVIVSHHIRAAALVR